MPKKNGMEVAQQILARVPDQRILIASAYSHEIAESGGSTQNVQVLQKPFEFDAFIGMVEQGPARSSQVKQSRTSNLININDINGLDNRSTHGRDNSDIFGLWR
jgi:hypothetical protein